MTACPIRYQRQVPDRKGKIFYTSITSLSHISKVLRLEEIIIKAGMFCKLYKEKNGYLTITVLSGCGGRT